MTNPHHARNAEEARLMMIAAVERDLAEWQAKIAAPWGQDDAEQPGRIYRRAGSAGATVVFTVRLDAAEREALRRRAALVDVPTSVLARNYIRIGLSRPPDPEDR